MIKHLMYILAQRAMYGEDDINLGHNTTEDFNIFLKNTHLISDVPPHY